MEAKVSVVVPVYNAEKYLRKCVNSIQKQTYTNLEIILVDDGAIDGSPQICDELQKSDKRIRVIHKENEGAGKSRNRGIDSATGDYIFFVDSDDYISEQLVEKCVQAAAGSKAALVMFGVDHVDESEKLIRSSIPYSDQYLFIDSDVTEKFLPEMLFSENKKIRNLEMTACMANFYSLDVIKKISWKFESEKEYMSEDLISLLKIYSHIKRLVVIDEALYYYRHGHESITVSTRWLDYSFIKKFYSQCLKVCKDNNYNAKVLRNASEPYLSFTITCLKVKIAQKRNMKTKMQDLNEILCDEQLHLVLKERNLNEEKRSKRLLYTAILKKHYLLAKGLILLQVLRSGK